MLYSINLLKHKIKIAGTAEKFYMRYQQILVLMKLLSHLLEVGSKLIFLAKNLL